MENTMDTPLGVQANILAKLHSCFRAIMTKAISLNPELEPQLPCARLHEIKSIITQIRDGILIPQVFPYSENLMMDNLQGNNFSSNDQASNLIVGYLFFPITFQAI